MRKFFKLIPKYVKSGFTVLLFGSTLKPVCAMGMNETCTVEPMQIFSQKKRVIENNYNLYAFLKSRIKKGLDVLSSSIKFKKTNLNSELIVKFAQKEQFLPQPVIKNLDSEYEILKKFTWKKYLKEKKYFFLSTFSYLYYNTLKWIKRLIQLIQRLKKKKKYLAWILLGSLVLLGIILGYYFRKSIFSFLKETFRKRNLRKYKKIWKNWKKKLTWENFLNKFLYWFEEVGSEDFEFIDPKDLTKGREIPKAPSGYTGTYSETP